MKPTLGMDTAAMAEIIDVLSTRPGKVCREGIIRVAERHSLTTFTELERISISGHDILIDVDIEKGNLGDHGEERVCGVHVASASGGGDALPVLKGLDELLLRNLQMETLTRFNMNVCELSYIDREERAPLEEAIARMQEAGEVLFNYRDEIGVTLRYADENRENGGGYRGERCVHLRMMNRLELHLDPPVDVPMELAVAVKGVFTKSGGIYKVLNRDGVVYAEVLDGAAVSEASAAVVEPGRLRRQRIELLTGSKMVSLERASVGDVVGLVSALRKWSAWDERLRRVEYHEAHVVEDGVEGIDDLYEVGQIDQVDETEPVDQVEVVQIL